MLPINRTVTASNESSCVLTANRGLNEGSVEERLCSASAGKDAVLDPPVCKLLLWTENQTQRNKEYLWSRSESACDFSALCSVLSTHLTFCVHSKQITLRKFIANKKQDLSACRLCWLLHMCSWKYGGAAWSGR